MFITTCAYSDTTPTPTPLTCGDIYEPNDDVGEAYGPLSSGSSYSGGKVCTDDDVDWFKVNITSIDTMYLQLEVTSSSDFDMELYNSSNNMVAYSANGTGQDESIVYNPTILGDYYIKIYGYRGSYNTSSSYTLMYTFSVSTTPIETPTPPYYCDEPLFHCDMYGYETHAYTGCATNITEYTATLNGEACCDVCLLTTYAEFIYWESGGNFIDTQSVSVDDCYYNPDYDNHISIEITGLKPSTVYFYYMNISAPCPAECCYDRCHTDGGYVSDFSSSGEIKTFSTAPILPDKGSLAGRINEYYPLEGVEFATIRIIGRKTRIDMKTTSDENGYFAFNYLDQDDYLIIVTKKDYKRTKDKVKLEAGENEYIEIELKKL
jgi:hypothetical protein